MTYELWPEIPPRLSRPLPSEGSARPYVPAKSPVRSAFRHGSSRFETAKPGRNGGQIRMTAAEPNRCHHIQDADGTWMHIPGCWGAIHGPEGCTCKVGGSALERAERARSAAEGYVETLIEKGNERAERLNAMFYENRRLRDEIERFRALIPASPDLVTGERHDHHD